MKGKVLKFVMEEGASVEGKEGSAEIRKGAGSKQTLKSEVLRRQSESRGRSGVSWTARCVDHVSSLTFYLQDRRFYQKLLLRSRSASSPSEKTPQACPPSLLLSPHCSFHFTHFLQLLCPRCQLRLALIGGPQLTV